MPPKPAWGFKLQLCLHRLKNNFLEQQLEEFNDKTREIEQALYEKQMQMAGTVFNKHDYMPKREVRKIIIAFYRPIGEHVKSRWAFSVMGRYSSGL